MTAPTISERLDAIREHMDHHRIDAYIVPSADEYLGEYIPERNRRLQWVSNFTGSAGMVIVLKDQAAIFVDGRYRVQVRDQVSTDLFSILHLIDDPQPEWLISQLPAGSQIGIDPRMHTYKWFSNTQKTLADANMELISLSDNLIDACWHDRPAANIKPVRLMPTAVAGRNSTDKRDTIGAAIDNKHADAALIFASDSSNWLLNIRGQDIPSLPLVLGVGLLFADGSMVYHMDLDKSIDGLEAHVGDRVTFKPESELGDSLAALAGKTVWADSDTTSAFAINTLIEAGARIINYPDPVLLPKAAKNGVEISGMKEAHLQDAVAEIGFLSWLDSIVAAGERPDEAALADKLLTFRQQQPDFVEVSFDTISAAGSNAAMCHYNHRNGTPAHLPENGVYLVDSGGQYLCGTTDITRTIAIGTPSSELCERFTLVLKGHIALDRMTFPEGTSGSQLDVLARAPLWLQGLDFDHGTGHGVGHFLSVHEGPQRIGKKTSEFALLPGMVLSNEPGYYKDGHYGIRCENLVVVKPAPDLGHDGKAFLQFEALTFVPFDQRLIVKDLLTADEIQWLNDYHEQVIAKVGPRLEAEGLAWLSRAARPM